MEQFLDFFTRAAGDWGLWIVFAVVFLETSAMIGLLVPGETTVLLAGALASRGVFDLGDLMAVVCVAAVLGDHGGYWLGRRLGRDFLLTHGRRFFIKPWYVTRAEDYFERHGGKTILFGRWVGFLRSLAPFLAGSAHMHYGRFTAYDLAGAVSWGAAVTVLGYVFGTSYKLVEQWLGRLSFFLLILVVAAALLWFPARWLWARKGDLGLLVQGLADRVLRWRAVRAVQTRFGRQITWLFNRFSPRRTYGLALTAGLALSVFLAWGFAVILESVVAAEPITSLDRVVAETLHENAIPWLTSTLQVVTYLGSAWVLVPAAVVMTFALVNRNRWGEGLVLLTAISGAALLTGALKLLIERPRPEFLEPLVEVGGYSFPSGHAASSAAFYMTLGLLAAGWVRNWETRVYVLLASLLVVALVGFSRLYLGAHYLSDVVAGYLLGAFWTTVATTAGVVLYRALSEESTPIRHADVRDTHARDHGHDHARDHGHDHGRGGAKVFSHERAAVLDDESRLQLLGEDELRRLLALKGDEDIVDLGSGTGFYTNRVAGWTTGRVYAVELQREMQEFHAANGAPKNIEMILSDADDLPLPEGSVDRALSINAFHEAHGEEGLRRLGKALRREGLFVIVDWRRDPKALEQGPRLEHRLSVSDITTLLSPFFGVVSTEDLGDSFVAIVARKL